MQISAINNKVKALPDWEPLYELIREFSGKTVEVYDRDFMEQAGRGMTEEFIFLMNSSDLYAGKSDFKAAKNILEMKTLLPVIIFDSARYLSYEEGLECFWLELFRTFTEKSYGMEEGCIGVFDRSYYSLPAFDKSESVLYKEKRGGLAAVKSAGRNQKNIVLQPSALKAAHYLKKRFGTPYEIGCPLDKLTF